MLSLGWSFRAIRAAILLGVALFPRPLLAQLNQAPVLAPVETLVGSAGVPLRISLSAMDPEGGALRFEIAGMPAGMVLTDNGDGTAECNWLPGPDQVGNHPLTFTVSDDGPPPASDSESITLTIGPGNRSPVLTPIGNRSYEPGVHLLIELEATDRDGDNLSYAVDVAPPGDVFLEDFGDGRARWNWVDPSGSDSYELTFTVTDSGFPPASASERIVLSLAGTNRPPVLSPIGDRLVRAGDPLLVSLSASDPDAADVLAFSALGVPPGAEFADLGGRAAELRWIPGTEQVGVFELVVAVADNGVPPEVASEVFRITVEAPPVEPEGDLRLDLALWSARTRLLFASGSGAGPRETVAILDAESGALLGVGRADSEGRFFAILAPFLAPCAVRASVLEAQSAARPVERAAEECGRQLLTRVRDLEWDCERSRLRLEAERAPASGAIDVSDAATGQSLGSIPADHRGRVDGRLTLLASPARVQLSARSGAAAWELGSFDVEDFDETCDESDEDADDDRCDDD
jgi:hypothetical protein